MKMCTKTKSRPRGFTLTEILVTLGIVAVLAVIGFQLGRRTISKARQAVDLGVMRTINNAILARTVENNDIAYTKQETGNSVYRQWDDPMSLCQVLKDHLPPEGSWISPAATDRHKKYKNSYAWSQSRKISFDQNSPETSYRVSEIENPGTVLTIWNNFGYTLPSGFNRAESNSVGPKQASKNYHYRPWDNESTVHWFYLDGHVATF